jgi:hypothetical protein
MAGGRPSSYTTDIGAGLCARLADGESLKAICAGDDMPDKATVYRWLAANDEFRDLYTRAREDQADTLADEIVAIADEECTMIRAEKHPGVRADDDDGYAEVVFDSTAVARNRLRVDARKWVAAKLKPKKYGDKIQQELSGPDGKDLLPPVIQIVAVAPK